MVEQRAVARNAMYEQLDAADLYSNMQALEAEDEGEDVGADEMADLLSKLRRQPADDAECAAKFELYEKYLETVIAMRKQTFDFWQEARADFPPRAQREGERQMKAIDSADNMGLPDFSEHRWFVFDMARKAHSNNDKIEAVLKGLQAKIQLLARQDECPICLDALPAAGGAAASGALPQVHVLGCCHKTCGACWEQWKKLAASEGKRPFCPLCRHEDFLGSVFTNHSRSNSASAVPAAAPGPAPAPALAPALSFPGASFFRRRRRSLSPPVQQPIAAPAAPALQEEVLSAAVAPPPAPGVQEVVPAAAMQQAADAAADAV